ncbi:MAG: lysozyme inhibitor LprI family protein [Chthoniobacterales bacterium]
MTVRCFISTAGVLLAVSANAQTASKMIPSDWVPALAPSITSALDRLKAASTQTEMNLLSREVAEMTDAQLFVAYVRLYEKLPPKERTALLAEQEKWLKARTKAAAAGIESEGGSLAPLEANNATVTFTEKRLKELRERFKTLQKKSE